MYIFKVKRGGLSGFGFEGKKRTFLNVEEEK